MKYRAEIDGLRALAVIPVILFHAGFELFSGGFVGVDVFFVISGYLITTILVDDIENNRFSIINFYERRARRILPALFFVMFMCIPFGWMWMLPSQMKDFSQSLVAVSLFASNVLFWRESGYFAAAAEEKVLLHTWSLAVEEQYYVLFPIFLFLAWRFGKNRVFWMIVVFAAISLALSEWGWRNKATANFYLAPTRAWELFAGSITAFIVQKRGVQTSDVLSLLGLAAVVFAIFAYDESTPFPSVYTLVPVTGVVLLIMFADKETLTAKLLSTKSFVGIGLISYSAYLWHQPLFAFARIKNLEHPSPELMLLLTLVSIVLAWLSWRFVETPFRNKENYSRRYIFGLSFFGVILFCTIGFIGHMSDGFRQENIVSIEKLLDVDIYVVGDSHAGHLVPGLKEITEGEVVNFTSAGCIPFRNVDRYDSRFEAGACAEKIGRFLDVLSVTSKKALVVLSAMGPVNLDGTTFMGKGAARVEGLGVKLTTDRTITNRYEIFEIGMRHTLEELLNNPNLTVVFAVDVPELGIDNGCGEAGKLIEIFGYQLTDLTHSINVPPSACLVSRAQYEERTGAYKLLVESVLEDFPEASLFDPTEYFCNIDYCTGYLDEFGYLYRDVDHLSIAGSRYFARSFANSLKKNVQ